MREDWSSISLISKTEISIEWSFTITFLKWRKKFQLHLKIQIDNYHVWFQIFEEGHTGSWLAMDSVWSKSQFNFNMFYFEPSIRWRNGQSSNQNKQEILTKWNAIERTNTFQKWFLQLFGSIHSSLEKEFPIIDPECTLQIIAFQAQLHDDCGISTN